MQQQQRPTRNIMIATRASLAPAQFGLVDIHLDAWQNLNYLGRITVNSGAPGAQVFRTLVNERKGQLEPCPEGVFNLGPLEWAGGKGNYDAQFPQIQSPIWVMIDPRRAIGFHLDGNRRTAPGSAGCLVFKTVDDMKKFVNWYNGYGAFQQLICNWGLGSVKEPAHLKRGR